MGATVALWLDSLMNGVGAAHGDHVLLYRITSFVTIFVSTTQSIPSKLVSFLVLVAASLVKSGLHRGAQGVATPCDPLFASVNSLFGSLECDVFGGYFPLYILYVFTRMTFPESSFNILF